jgi:hypothetical protein
VVSHEIDQSVCQQNVSKFADSSDGSIALSGIVMKRALVFAAAVSMPVLAVASELDCGRPGSRWIADAKVDGSGSGPKIITPIDAHLNLEIIEEGNFTVAVRDRATGEDIFGSSPHAGDAYQFSAGDVRATRRGEVLSMDNDGNVISLVSSANGGELVIDARALYSTREDDPNEERKDERFARGVLHVCWLADASLARNLD